MRHAALAALLAATPAAAAGDYGFTESLRGIESMVRPGRGVEPRFQQADWVQPQRRPGLEQLDRERADLFTRTLPATFIVRLGEAGQRTGTGSGFFINPDGTGMTNAHVVGTVVGAEVDIETVRGMKRARVLAVAPGRDIAIIKVINDRFADWAALTPGAALREGHGVFAIGNPVDQGVSFSRGMVSRPSQDKMSPWMDVLQLDLMINPGNSGGALVDASGRLVGMNQAVARAETVDGLSFAIPVQELTRARDEFAATGALVDAHTSLVVAGPDLTVMSVGAAPAAAGFQAGDAVVSFPGSSSVAVERRASALQRAAARGRVGQTIVVEVTRAAAARLHTAPTAGAPATASIDAVFNPATGIGYAAGTPALRAFIMAVTPASAEEVEFAGSRYVIEPLNQAGPQGMLFRATGFVKKAQPTVTLNLPIEAYSPVPAAAAAGVPAMPGAPGAP
ncbi:MAG: serine protease [Elusimicrobiota bacterium]|nr:serine protease [Elusimicrobiota bacterium]